MVICSASLRRYLVSEQFVMCVCVGMDVLGFRVRAQGSLLATGDIPAEMWVFRGRKLPCPFHSAQNDCLV